MILRSIAAAVLTLASCGCANSLLYDESRDKQGQAVVKAVEEAHLTSTVESMNKAFADMAAREESRAREIAEQQFEWEMVEVSRVKLDAKRSSGDTGNGLETKIRERLSALGLMDFSATMLADISMKPVELGVKRDALENKLSSFLGAYAIQFDNCAQIVGTSSDPKKPSDVPSDKFLERIKPALRNGAKGEYKGLVEDCVALDTLRAESVKPYVGGVILGLANSVADQGRITKNYAAAKAQAAKDLAAAKDAAKESIAKAKAGKPRLDAVEQKAQTILDSLDAARALSDVAASEVFASDKLEDLESILKALTGAKPDGKITLTQDQQLTIGVLRNVIDLGDEADTLFAEAAKPRLVPLLAAIDYHKLILEKIEAARKVEVKNAGLIGEQLQAALDESAALAEILSAIVDGDKQRDGVNQVPWSNESIEQLNKRLEGDDKRFLYEKLGTYGDTVREARVAQAVLSTRTQNTVYEKNLIDSRYAAAQWDALMDMTAKVLADYHAAGIKPADIAEFFKALGLVTIGVGAAQ